MTTTEEPVAADAEREQAETALDEARVADAEETVAELAAAEPAQEPAHPVLMVSDQAMALIKSTLNPDLTDGEVVLFSQVCNRVGLDPFAKQIYAVKRGGRMTIQTGIDGFRLIARRTGRYGGRLGAYFCGADGEWQMTPDGKPKPWLASEAPSAALVGVVVKGDLEPTYGVAKWAEYAVTGSGGDMWKRMPTTMLAKCAEAQALRAAFPAETSGLYTDDEMMQADALPASSSVNGHEDLDELGDEAVRFDVACRVLALDDEHRSILRERWKANRTLTGDSGTTAPMNLTRRQVGAANAIVNGVESEAKKTGWDPEAAFAAVKAQILALAGQEEPVTDSSPPAAPAEGDGEPETASEPDGAQDEPDLADFTEDQRAVIETVKALPIKAVDKRLVDEFRLDVRGKTGQERRGMLAHAILVDQGKA